VTDCRTCKHNTYRDLKDCTFVSCGHPVTLEKTPKAEDGDPAWVNALTCDMKISEMFSMGMLDGCKTWEAVNAL
jgi:hypothetical protein